LDPYQNSFFLFIYFVWKDCIWTQNFTLAKQALYCLSHRSFLIVYFQDGRPLDWRCDSSGRALA
jgi:hypothetical protein